LIRWWTR